MRPTPLQSTISTTHLHPSPAFPPPHHRIYNQHNPPYGRTPQPLQYYSFPAHYDAVWPSVTQQEKRDEQPKGAERGAEKQEIVEHDWANAEQ